jgi:hypothetical protein
VPLPFALLGGGGFLANDASFQHTKAHLNSLLFIFSSARALENVSIFFRKCCNIFQQKC